MFSLREYRRYWLGEYVLLSDKIRRLREEMNLNQLELSKILNISNTTLSQYESGNRTPSDDIKKAIAEYFDVSLDYLMGQSNIRNPYNQMPGRFNRTNNTDNNDLTLPDEFSTPEEAMKFLLEQNVIMGFGGFDVDKLTDDEKVEFANSLLEHLKLLSLKYKK